MHEKRIKELVRRIYEIEHDEIVYKKTFAQEINNIANTHLDEDLEVTVNGKMNPFTCELSFRFKSKRDGSEIDVIVDYDPETKEIRQGEMECAFEADSNADVLRIYDGSSPFNYADELKERLDRFYGLRKELLDTEYELKELKIERLAGWFVEGMEYVRDRSTRTEGLLEDNGEHGNMTTLMLISDTSDDDVTIAYGKVRTVHAPYLEDLLLEDMDISSVTVGRKEFAKFVLFGNGVWERSPLEPLYIKQFEQLRDYAGIVSFPSKGSYISGSRANSNTPDTLHGYNEK